METLSIPKQETEVAAKASRRRFTAEEKRRILAEGDRCTQPGELGALLRREGLYSSLYYMWRRARDEGGVAALSKKRGPKPKEVHPLEKENEQLKRALAKAEARVRRAEALIEVQKKVSDLLGIQFPKDEETP